MKVSSEVTYRYAMLRHELDDVRAEVERLLGPGGW